MLYACNSKDQIPSGHTCKTFADGELGATYAKMQLGLRCKKNPRKIQQVAGLVKYDLRVIQAQGHTRTYT